MANQWHRMIEYTLGMISMDYLANCVLGASFPKPKPPAEQPYFSYSIFKLFSSLKAGEGSMNKKGVERNKLARKKVERKE